MFRDILHLDVPPLQTESYLAGPWAAAMKGDIGGLRLLPWLSRLFTLGYLGTCLYLFLVTVPMSLLACVPPALPSVGQSHFSIFGHPEDWDSSGAHGVQPPPRQRSLVQLSAKSSQQTAPDPPRFLLLLDMACFSSFPLGAPAGLPPLASTWPCGEGASARILGFSNPHV